MDDNCGRAGRGARYRSFVIRFSMGEDGRLAEEAEDLVSRAAMAPEFLSSCAHSVLGVVEGAWPFGSWLTRFLLRRKVRSQAVGSVSPCVPLTCRYLPRWWSHSCNLCKCPIEILAFYASRTCRLVVPLTRTALPFHISFFFNSL